MDDRSVHTIAICAVHYLSFIERRGKWFITIFNVHISFILNESFNGMSLSTVHGALCRLPPSHGKHQQLE